MAFTARINKLLGWDRYITSKELMDALFVWLLHLIVEGFAACACSTYHHSDP
jgi:hypothetical protein